MSTYLLVAKIALCVTEIDELPHQMAPNYNSITKHFLSGGSFSSVFFQMFSAPVAAMTTRQVALEERLGTAERLNYVNTQRKNFPTV